MQPVWISIFSSRQFVGTFENTPWRGGKTMQPVSIYMHQGRPFEDAFENTTQWRKADLMNHMGQSKKLLNQKKQKYINFTRHMKVKVYNLVRRIIY